MILRIRLILIDYTSKPSVEAFLLQIEYAGKIKYLDI